MPRMSCAREGPLLFRRMRTVPVRETVNSKMSPCRSRAASATFRGMRTARLFPHFASCVFIGSSGLSYLHCRYVPLCCQWRMGRPILHFLSGADLAGGPLERNSPDRVGIPATAGRPDIEVGTRARGWARTVASGEWRAPKRKPGCSVHNCFRAGQTACPGGHAVEGTRLWAAQHSVQPSDLFLFFCLPLHYGQLSIHGCGSPGD